jgi:rod shape determining protein RodA
MMDLSLYRHTSWAITACACAIIALGLLFIYSGSYGMGKDAGGTYVTRQAVWAVAGVIVAALLVSLDYRRLSVSAFMIYGVFIVLLVVLLFTSDPRRGARSWFSVGAFAVQPSEFAKIALILALAKYLSREDIPRRSVSYLGGALILAAVPIALILKEPDLGTAMVFTPVIFAMLVVAGARGAYLTGILMTGVLSLPLGWLFLKPYQRLRIKVFLDPQLDPLRSGYNAIQSLIAVGGGGISGQGWLNGTQTHLRFLPERHTDFIFCVLAEEAGFMGCAVLLALYAVILLNGLRIAEQARDEFGKLVAVGITVLLAAHVVINIGMTIGLLPITGLPLPLMSYGGSSLMSSCICLGILQSIGARRYVF